MHDSSSKDIFIPPIVTKGLTPKITQLIVNPGCDVAWFSYEVFHDRIDQGVNSIRNSSTYAFVKDGGSFLIFLDCILDIFPNPSVRQLFHHCRSLPVNPEDMSSMTSV